MDNKACKLEAEHEVKARIARLKRLAAEKATTTRAEVLAGISYTFQAGIARVRGAGDGRQLDYTSVNAVTQLGKTLLDALPKEGGGRRLRPSGPSAGTLGRRADAVNLPRRRAHRHAPVAATQCLECYRQWEIGQLVVFRLALTQLLLRRWRGGRIRCLPRRAGGCAC